MIPLWKIVMRISINQLVTPFINQTIEKKVNTISCLSITKM